MAATTAPKKLLSDLVLNSAHHQRAQPLTIPAFVYGTAWKKERSADLVYQALVAGFRGIDTAAQPRHYREELVAEGLKRAIADGVVKREEVYVRVLLVWYRD